MNWSESRGTDPWHCERLEHLDLGTLGEDDLARIPVMRKHDLMTYFDRIVTNPHLTLNRVKGHLDRLTTDDSLESEERRDGGRVLLRHHRLRRLRPAPILGRLSTRFTVT